MSKKRSYKEKRLKRKAKKKQKVELLRTNEEARYQHVQKLGQVLITKKWREGKGKSRHQGKESGDNYKYITSEKAFRDISAVWRRFSQYAAENSSGEDLDTLEDLMKYADDYIQQKIDEGLSAWTLTTYKAHLGKVFNVPTTHFIATPSRERKNAKRLRVTSVNDTHISKEKRDFFEKIGTATGLRKQEMMKIKGTALYPKRAKNGLWYICVSEGTKGRKIREKIPIMATSSKEEAEIIEYFQKAGRDYVFSGKNGTYRVPKKLDEHAHRAEYAKRVYLHYERDLNKLNRKEKTYLRKELRGYVLDKQAELKASKALGHNREDEFRKSYAYLLVSR
ncbi:hypothetical protein [Streptococcus hyovaginalis]|uniref:hypothetical protein n=1 Tax=Streptococcus hyovaginalis TaxID=149015 RepID=UPI0014791B8C|nr:hypothetical protein [Streptococcus hyovaginalis]